MFVPRNTSAMAAKRITSTHHLTFIRKAGISVGSMGEYVVIGENSLIVLSIRKADPPSSANSIALDAIIITSYWVLLLLIITANKQIDFFTCFDV